MDKSAVTLERMQFFVRVVERSSFSAVAREFGVGQSTVTRQIADLEGALGVSLLRRTTRRLAVTEEGQRYYDDCIRILCLVDRANDDVQLARRVPSGIVRIACTSAFSVLHLSKVIFDFQDQHSDIQIELYSTDEQVNLIEDGFDLSICKGVLNDSSLRIRSLGWCSRILVAAPSCLTAQQEPRTPSDLANYEVVRMSQVSGSDHLILLDPANQRITVPLTGRLRVDHGLVLREALVAGRGFAVTYRWLVDDLIQSRKLKIILPDYKVDLCPLNLIIAPDREEALRVRLLIDFLAESICSIPGISKN